MTPPEELEAVAPAKLVVEHVSKSFRTGTVSVDALEDVYVVCHYAVGSAVAPEVVAFLLGRLDRPLVTTVMPPLPEAPQFRALVKRTRRGQASGGALMLYDSGLAYATERGDDARFWRFGDIFAVLALDPFRLQVLAYEGGSGATRSFTFDLMEPLPPGMFDALWQRVNRPDRRPYRVDVPKEVDTMNHRLTMAGILALSVAAGSGPAVGAQEQHQHAATAPAGPMEVCQRTMAAMQANTDKLEALASQMNAATGQAKMAAMADLLTALVKERSAMTAAMKTMPVGAGMSSMPMGHEMTAMHAANTPAMSTPPATGPLAPAAFDLTFRIAPDPPRAGDNATLEVSLKDDAGRPVTDAVVTVAFYMPPMGAMAAMRSTPTLKHDAGGIYRGTGQVTMAGRWDVTISATGTGKDLGTKRLTITAR